MKNEEKNTLAHYVKQCINNGYNLNRTVNSLVKYGFKKATIKKYYKAFKYNL